MVADHVGRRLLRVLAPAALALQFGCPAVGGAGNASDAGALHAEMFHPGEFGPLHLSPDRSTLLVRGRLPHEAWQVDDFGRQRIRPRLFAVTRAGDLELLAAQAGETVWFTQGGGVLYEDKTTGTLWHRMANGAVSEVLDRFGSLSIDGDGRMAILTTQAPREHAAYDAVTGVRFQRSDFVPWHVSPNAGCVVGYQNGEIRVAWQNGNADTVVLTGAPPSGGRAVITPACTHVVYQDATQMLLTDLTAGSTVAVSGVTQPQTIRRLVAAPGGTAVLFADGAGLRRLDLNAVTLRTLVPAPLYVRDVSRGNHHWLLWAYPNDPTLHGAGACYLVVVVDLETGAVVASTRFMCPELVGYAQFVEDESLLMWSDGPFNAMASTMDGTFEVQYCGAFQCAAPGRAAPGGHWLAVPMAAEPTPEIFTHMSLADLHDTMPEPQPIHTALQPYDRYWTDLVRFDADAHALVFGSQVVVHNPAAEGPCPAQLWAGRVAPMDAWAVADDVTHAEVTGDNRLAYVVGQALPPGGVTSPSACALWQEPQEFAPGLHVVPYNVWSRPPR